MDASFSAFPIAGGKPRSLEYSSDTASHSGMVGLFSNEKQCLRLVNSTFKSLMADQLALELFQTCMSLAHCFLPKYANEFVQPAADSVRAYQDLDSKGKSVSLETLISSIFDLMGSLATTRDQIRSFLGTPSNNIGDSKLISLIIVLIGYSSISQVQEITWEESVGEVICEENEASFAFSARKRALELILVSIFNDLLRFITDAARDSRFGCHLRSLAGLLTMLGKSG